MSATWKAAERRIAAQLGGTRVPVSGRARGDAPDIRVPGSPWSIEVKHTASPYERIEDALRQAEASADVGQNAQLARLLYRGRVQRRRHGPMGWRQQPYPGNPAGSSAGRLTRRRSTGR